MYILAKIVKHSYINGHFIQIHDTPFQDYDRDKAMEIAKKEKYNVIYANSDFVGNLGEPDKIKNDEEMYKAVAGKAATAEHDANAAQRCGLQGEQLESMRLHAAILRSAANKLRNNKQQSDGQDRKSYSDNQDRKNYYINKDLTEETLEKNDDYWLEDFKKNYPIDWLEKENLDKRDNKE